VGIPRRHSVLWRPGSPGGDGGGVQVAAPAELDDRLEDGPARRQRPPARRRPRPGRPAAGSRAGRPPTRRRRRPAAWRWPRRPRATAPRPAKASRTAVGVRPSGRGRAEPCTARWTTERWNSAWWSTLLCTGSSRATRWRPSCRATNIGQPRHRRRRHLHHNRGGWLTYRATGRNRPNNTRQPTL